MTILRETDTLDLRIAHIAAAQHGIVRRDQLRALGMSTSAIHRRTATGRLHRIHVGVYAVGHPGITWEARVLAAVFACGPGAAATGATAARLLKSTRHPSTEIVILATRRVSSLRGVRVIFTECIAAQDVVMVDRIPVTRMARTLVEMAGTSTPNQLAFIMHEAEWRNRLDVAEIERLAARFRTRRGMRNLAAALELHARGSAGTFSDLEDLFVQLLVEACIELPLMNHPVNVDDGRPPLVDAVWVRQRLCVEIDGWGHHRMRSRREDAARMRRLRAAGYRVLRFTADEIERDPAGVVARIRAELARIY